MSRDATVESGIGDESDASSELSPSPNAPVSNRTITAIAELRLRGLISERDVADLEMVADRFSVRITPAMAGLIDPNDGESPIARQFVPGTAELEIDPGERADPIGDKVHEPVAGITHRYADRVLLKPTHLCQVYCRFCFRRETVGQAQETLSVAQTNAALSYIRDNSSIWEVILSGGDPLILSSRRISELLAGLEAIDHVSVVRIHTRAPIVAPERVDDALLSIMRRRFPMWIVLHVNHADEITAEARAAISKLADAGLPLLAQTVLLKGVNDHAGTLERLFRRLVELRVKPYYLHHLDLAEGTGHFRTSIVEGQAVMRDLRGRVSGLCQPTYVLDIPGGHGKIPIGPNYVAHHSDGTYTIEDPNGRQHPYRDLASAASKEDRDEAGLQPEPVRA